MQSTLEQDVEEYLHPQARPRLRLGFPRALETLYELDRLDPRSLEVMLTGLVAMVFYDLFLFADYAKHPSVIWRCIVVRLCVATPVSMVTVWFVRRRARTSIREALILCCMSVSGGGVLAISYNLNRVDSIFSQTGLMLIIFFGSLILRQQFAYGAVTMVLLLLEDALFLATDRWMTGDDKITAVFMVFASAILALIANFMMERQERLTFAHSLNEGFQTKALARMNQKLTALSQVDGLTGLSNRRHFEQRFQELWHEAADRRQALSLLMIDIDHFKRLNDTFGHIAGDQVLIKMAQVLMASVRANEDLVARFGGEEFILLLAGASHEDAHEVAEDLRLLAYRSPLLPAGGDALGPVSVSCGVATCFPTAVMTESDRLTMIDEADLALYAAKAAGRNRVCCRLCETLPPEQQWPPRHSEARAESNTSTPAFR